MTFTQPIAIGLAGLVLLAASIGPTEAAGRKVTVTGSGGHGYTKSVDHYCFEGSCYTQSELTTAYGADFLRSRSCTLTAPGQYSCAGSLTGPAGNSVHRSTSTSITW